MSIHIDSVHCESLSLPIPRSGHLKQVEIELRQRFDRIRSEHDSSLDSQREFSSRLLQDIQGLKDKCEDLESQVLLILGAQHA